MVMRLSAHRLTGHYARRALNEGGKGRRAGSNRA
jgi:hypothetical protein